MPFCEKEKKMKNDRIVQEVRGVMTRFEPLTAEALNAATNGEMTLQEVEAALELLGLDLEHVVHDPTRHNLNTFYADYQRGLYLELYLTSQFLQEIPQVFAWRVPKEGEVVQELADQDWERFYSRRVPVPMAIYDFQQRYLELPAEQIFSIWYSIHKRIDYSNDMWRPEVLGYVFSQAPAPELPAADEDGLITLYRGMGSLSQTPERALSWSSHPTSALWFAVHFARGTHIAVARVRPDQIVHYAPGYYNENEVLVRPGAVKEFRYEDMIPAIEDTVPQMLIPAVPDFLAYGLTAQKLGYRPVRFPYVQVHGLMHILRVLLLSLIYYYNSGDTLSEADKQILVYFSLLHDLGRTSEDCDDNHGDASVAMIRTKGIRLKGIRLSAKDHRIAELMIRFHCRDDQAGFDAIQAAPDLSKKDRERACHLYCICKDMDGLDRVRFNGLDYRMLRTEYGRRLPLVAGCLLEESLLEALQYGLGKGTM